MYYKMKILLFIMRIFLVSIFIVATSVSVRAQDYKTILNRGWQSHQAPAQIPSQEPLQAPAQQTNKAASSTINQNRQNSKVLQKPKTTLSPPAVHYVEKLPNAKKILFIGDFIANAVSDGLNEIYADNPNYIIVKRTQGSSGLVRDDFYNWHINVPKIVAQENPDIIIFSIGANDRQPFKVDKKTIEYGTIEWNSVYQKQINNIIKDLQITQKPWLWIGLPSFGKIQLHQSAGLFNSYFNAAIGHVNGQADSGQFIDLWNGFVDEKGAFALSGFDMNGQTTRLRTNDGINFTSAGRQKLGFYLKTPLEAILNAPTQTSEKNTMSDKNQQEKTAISDKTSAQPLQVTKSSKKIDYIAPTLLTDMSNKNSDLLGGDVSSYSAIPFDKHIKYDEQKGRADYFVQP